MLRISNRSPAPRVEAGSLGDGAASVVGRPQSLERQQNLARMIRGQTDRAHIASYTARAKKDLMYDIAAQSWAWGLPWTEAYTLAKQAVAKGSAKPKAWPKVKANAKPKVRAKASPSP